MVSAIIVFIGILKPILFNRIKCKPLRKFLLGLSDVVFSFAAVAIYYAIEGFTWENYVWASVGVSVLCILAYWLYETTPLRATMDAIGNFTIKKVINVAFFAFNNVEKEQILAEIDKAKSEIQSTAKNELKSATSNLKKDKELEKL